MQNNSHAHVNSVSKAQKKIIVCMQNFVFFIFIIIIIILGAPYVVTSRKSMKNIFTDDCTIYGRHFLPILNKSI